MSPSSFGKRDRERAKKAKAEAKCERRAATAAQSAVDAAGDPDATETAAPPDDVSTADLLRKIEEVHRLHDEGQITDDDFQETKAELLGRLPVD